MMRPAGITRTTSGTTALGFCLLSALGAAPAPRRPEAAAGPYRVLVERISASRTVNLLYRQEAPADPGQFQQRRTVQLQLAIHAPDAASAAGLTRVDFFGVTAEAGGKIHEVGHYGGKLETATTSKAVLRGYLYAPTLPGEATEIRSLEGEILAYEHSTPVEVEVPLQPPFREVEQDGVRVTVRELTVSEGTARVTLSAEGPASSVLIAPGDDGNHGVRLLDRQNRLTSLGGGSLLQPRPQRLEYRVTFQSVRTAPRSLRVKVTKQHGRRSVWPFRLERIPLPQRLTPG